MFTRSLVQIDLVMCSWGSNRGPLTLTRYGNSGSVSVPVATLVPAYDGQLNTQRSDIPAGSTELLVRGAGLRPVGCHLEDITVQLVAANGPCPIGSVKPGTYNQDWLIINLVDFERTLPGELSIVFSCSQSLC